MVDRSGRAETGFLTSLQLSVLKLRAEGLTQAQTAASLGLSRAAVSMIESRAMRTVKKARETLEVAAVLGHPVKVSIEPPQRISDIPSMVFSAADRAGIRVRTTLLDLVRMIMRSSPPCAKSGRLTRKVVFILTPSGKIELTVG
ncbi:MAG: Tfx family DNA-binding protein [Thermoprotei archaeon]